MTNLQKVLSQPPNQNICRIVGRGVFKIISATDLYVANPLSMEVELTQLREKATRKLRQKALKQSPTNELGLAYFQGGLDHVLSEARKLGFYRTSDRIRRWSDFSSEWETRLREILAYTPAQLSPKQVQVRQKMLGGPLFMSASALEPRLPGIELARVEQVMGYTYCDRRYLAGVLLAGNSGVDRTAFQRQEYLGDAVLELLACEYCSKLSANNHPIGNMVKFSVCNNFLGIVTILIGCHNYVRWGQDKWKRIQPAIEHLLDLRDVKKAYTSSLETLPSLHGRLGSLTLEDMLPYLRRRIKAEKWLGLPPFWDKLQVPKGGGDFFEALVGSVYHDSGFDFEAATRVFDRTVRVILDEVISLEEDSSVGTEQQRLPRCCDLIDRKVDSGYLSTAAIIG
ncbi:hypothetical protein BGW42_001470 [Actinomortierella wolfii]|nr:hypothetical protein BGW42_001470 [Actinomortierella wolfii]